MTDPLASIKAALKKDGSVTIAFRARPGARRTGIAGQLADGSVKIDLAAPPESGKANAALLKFLAGEFAVGPGRIELLAGAGARRKTVRIRR